MVKMPNEEVGDVLRKIVSHSDIGKSITFSD